MTGTSNSLKFKLCIYTRITAIERRYWVERITFKTLLPPGLFSSPKWIRRGTNRATWRPLWPVALWIIWKT